MQVLSRSQQTKCRTTSDIGKRTYGKGNLSILKEIKDKTSILSGRLKLKCLQERKVIDNLISEVNLESCRVTNCGPNPKGVGYRPNKPNTINL